VSPLLCCSLFFQFCKLVAKTKEPLALWFFLALLLPFLVAWPIRNDTPMEQKGWHRLLLLFLSLFLLVSIPLNQRDDRSNHRHQLFFVGCVGVNDEVSPLLFCNFLIFRQVGGRNEVTVGVMISSCLFSSSFWLLSGFRSTCQANNRLALSAFSVTFFASVSIILNQRDDHFDCRHRLFFVGCYSIEDKASSLFSRFWQVGGWNEATVSIVICPDFASSFFWLLGLYGLILQWNQRSASLAFPFPFFFCFFWVFRVSGTGSSFSFISVSWWLKGSNHRHLDYFWPWSFLFLIDQPKRIDRPMEWYWYCWYSLSLFLFFWLSALGSKRLTVISCWR